MTLLFTDDNVGNLRRLPTPEERRRSGGAGIYFHMDMNGGPFSYKWLNSNPLPKVWEQMNLALRYGATRIWIANVGDLKPLEVPVEFFLRMGYDPGSITPNTIAEYQRLWAAREFGTAHAYEIADLVGRYAKHSAWRKPELIRPETFSQTNYQEAERVSAAWHDLLARAELLKKTIPADQHDAFYELVYHPIAALSNFVDIYIGAGRNAVFARQRRVSANAQAELVRTLFARDQSLSTYYNDTLADGKWRHMMDQVHIGYKLWSTPRANILPDLVSDTPVSDSAIGIAIDGSAEAWPGSAGAAMLPTLNSLDGGRTFIDVFARGMGLPRFEASADQPWIHLRREAAPYPGGDQRLWLEVDWKRAPVGATIATITVAAAGTRLPVTLTAIKATPTEEGAAHGSFGGLIGPIAIAADEASRNIPANGAAWTRLPDLGRASGAMEVFPVTAATVQPPGASPRLEYPLYFSRAGTYDIDVITSPTLDVIPTRGLGLALGIDDGMPQVVNVFTPDTFASEDFLGAQHWQNTANNVRTMRFTQTVTTPGTHVLKIMMVDPTVVLQKIVIHDTALPASYFGPPERPRNGTPK